MNDPVVDNGVRSLGDLFQATEIDQSRAVFQFMRSLLNDGAPIAVVALARSLGTSEPDGATLARELRARGGEIDDEGRLVGFGLTLVPTPHRYQAEGRDLYVWCADEALIFPAIFDHTAVIRSPDPVTGERIAATVSSEGVEGLEPASAVVSRVTRPPDIDDVRGSGCYFGHFFTGATSAAAYVDRHAEVGLAVLPVNTVFRIGKAFVRRDPLMKTILSEIGVAG